MTFTGKLDPHRNSEELAHDRTGLLASGVYTSVKLEKISYFYRKITIVVMFIKGGRSRREKLTLQLQLQLQLQDIQLYSKA